MNEPDIIFLKQLNFIVHSNHLGYWYLLYLLQSPPLALSAT